MVRAGSIIILAIALSSQAHAAPTDGPSLTLDDALALARKHNHSVALERGRLSEAQTAIEQTSSALLPTVAGQARFTRNYKTVDLDFNGANLLLQPLNQWDLGVTATAPIIVPLAYVALAAVKTSVHASEARFDTAEADVLMGVANAFLLAAATDEVLVARRSSVGLLEEALQVAQKRQAVGAVTTFDVDRAQLALVQSRQQVAEAGNERAKAYRALGTLLGVDGPLAIQTQFSQQAAPAADDVGHALELRPEYRAAEQTLRAAEAQRRARAWEWAPSLSAFGNVRRFNYDNFALDDYSWAVGGQLDWVFFDGGARDARRHAAAAEEVQAQAQIALVREGIRDDLANSVGTLRTKRQGLDAAEQSVALSGKALDMARVLYETGVGTQLDLLQAQDAVVTSRVQLAQAHFDVASADLALRHAAGTFPPK